MIGRPLQTHTVLISLLAHDVADIVHAYLGFKQYGTLSEAFETDYEEWIWCCACSNWDLSFVEACTHGKLQWVQRFWQESSQSTLLLEICMSAVECSMNKARVSILQWLSKQEAKDTACSRFKWNLFYILQVALCVCAWYTIIFHSTDFTMMMIWEAILLSIIIVAIIPCRIQKNLGKQTHPIVIALGSMRCVWCVGAWTGVDLNNLSVFLGFVLVETLHAITFFLWCGRWVEYKYNLRRLLFS